MFENNFCKISYLSDKKAILCEWKKFCKDTDYREPLEYGLQLLNQHKAKTWITILHMVLKMMKLILNG